MTKSNCTTVIIIIQRWSQKKPLLKGCSAIQGSNNTCIKCPKRCSYGVHLHVFEKGVETVDEAAMQDLQRKIDKLLSGCKK